jgi:hypothetical protein
MRVPFTAAFLEVSTVRRTRMSTSAYKLAGTATSDAADRVTGSGWLTFAGVMLGIVGVYNVIDGALAISRSHVYATDATYVFSNLRTWGWIILGLGALQVLAGVGIFERIQLARWFGVFAAGLNAIGQLLFIQAYPFWSLAAFSIDIMVIYALAVYGGRRPQTEAP